MKHLINFLKGIIVGIGGILPGLSGSVLLVIFGLYEKTIDAVGTLFKDFKKNVLFLIPLFLGFGIGMILFSKIAEYFLENHTLYTKYLFLGLVIGTMPLFFKETRKKGWHNKYYIPMLIAFMIGIVLFIFSAQGIKQTTNPNLFQSIFLGFMVATSTIIPGVDSATILQTLGLYQTYLTSINSMNLQVLIPAAFGVLTAGLGISYLMNKILKKNYTLVFSIIFGLFIAIIPSIIKIDDAFEFYKPTLGAVSLSITGFLISFLLGRIKKPELDETSKEE